MNKIIVYSPRKLSSEEKEKLKRQIDVPEGESIIDFAVDESLIDGLKIIYNDKMLDLSLDSQIKSLRED